MRIIQKILSYGLLITFMVAVFVMFQNRDQLFPQWFGKDKSSQIAHNSNTTTASKNTLKISRAEPVEKAAPKKVEDTVESVQTPAEKVESVAAQKTDAVNSENDEQAVSAEEASAVEQPQTVTEPEQEIVVAEKLVVASEQPKPSSDPTNYRPLEVDAAVEVVEVEIAEAEEDKDKDKKEVEKVNEITKVADEEIQPPSTPSIEPVHPEIDGTSIAKVEKLAEEEKSEPVNVEEIVTAVVEPISSSAAVTPQKDVQAIQKNLDNARSLYWKRDVEAAVFAYQQVVTTDPNHAQAWGELGNLYFNHGRWPEAADSYYQAGMLLVDQGDPERASQILRVLHGLDVAKGKKLQERLESSAK